MKIITDFVSNSSSCSFIICMTSLDDIKNFKEVFNNIIQSKFKDVTIDDYRTLRHIDNNLDDISINDILKIDCCDDSIENVLNFYDIQTIILDPKYNFKIYCDKEEHYSFGKELRKLTPEEIDKDIRNEN